MSLIQLYIPVEAAQAVTLRAGDLGLVQFRDVPNFIRRCHFISYSCLVEYGDIGVSKDVYWRNKKAT